MDENHVAVIADFGMAEINNKYNVPTVQDFAGTLRYKAPEIGLQLPTKQPEKQDVYSFGIVMWEVLHESIAFQTMTDDEIIKQIWKQKKRPEVLKPAPTSYEGSLRVKLIELMEACWDHDPEKRPDFGEISQRLNTLSRYTLERYLKEEKNCEIIEI